MGTLLLLAVGTHNTNIVTRALAARPMSATGDYSYSIYLWHWPFIAFAALLWPETSYALLIAAVASLAPALASYKWVEQPIRTLQGLTQTRLATLVAAVVVAPIVVALSVGTAATNFWKPRYESGDVVVANEGDIGQAEWHAYVRDSFHPCTPKSIREQALKWDGILRCQQSKRGQDTSIAVIGDSHAEHLFLGLAEALPQSNVVYYILDDALVPTNPDVARIVNHVAASSSIKTVVVSEFWHDRKVRGAELLMPLRKLSRDGRTLFVTDDVPFFPFEAFGCKYRKAFFLPARCSMKADMFRRDYSRYYAELLATVRQVPRAKMLNTARYFCGETVCEMNRDGRVLYRDHSHLNILGSRFVARQILKDYPAFVAATAEARWTKSPAFCHSAFWLSGQSPSPGLEINHGRPASAWKTKLIVPERAVLAMLVAVSFGFRVLQAGESDSMDLARRDHLRLARPLALGGR